MSLKQVIVDRLRETVWDSTQGRAVARCVLVGPPESVLESVFAEMTTGGTSDWTVSAAVQVPVVLVGSTESAEQIPSASSAKGTWDYALNMRDSFPASVVLANRSVWDIIPESISNAAVIIGEPTGLDFGAEPWSSVISAIAELGVVNRAAVRSTLKALADERMAVRALSSDPHWDFADAVLRSEQYAYAAGLPYVPAGGHVDDYSSAIERASAALTRLADRFADEGLQEAGDGLRDAAAEIEPETERAAVTEAVDALLAHVARTAGSGLGFRQAPHLYFRPSTADELWWRSLRPSILEQLIPHAPPIQNLARLETSVRDFVATTGRVVVVQDDLIVDAALRGESGSIAPDGAVLKRGTGRSVTEVPFVPTIDGTAASAQDSPPPHDKPVTYRVHAGDLGASLRVVSLDSFLPGGFVLDASADGVLLPAVDQGEGGYLQELPISVSGDRQLRLYATSRAVTCTVAAHGEPVATVAVRDGRADFGIHLSHQDTVELTLKDESGEACGEWHTRALVEGGSDRAPASEWERLVQANSQRALPPPARAPFGPIRELEARIVAFENGTRGAIACWSETVGSNPGEFDQSGRIGDMEVPVELDPRPNDLPSPEPYLTARTSLAIALRRRNQPILELDLRAPELMELVSDYAAAYVDWVTDDRLALWAETVSLFVERPRQPGTVSTEPVAILLPPTHPLKIAWLANAQRVLRDAIDSGRRCPLASALDPSASPRSVTLDLQRADSRQARSFIAAPSGDPYWGLLVNSRDIANRDLRAALHRVLGWLRLVPENVGGGLSAQHTARALDEIVAMSPTRSVLRIGIASAADGAGPVADAVLAWGTRMLAGWDDGEEATSGVLSGLRHIQVVDYRHNPTNPSPASLAGAGDRTRERVLWMREPSPEVGATRPDLTLVEDIELTNHELVTGPARSILGRGGLTRFEIRDDPGDATWVSESRTSAPRAAANGEAHISSTVAATVAIMESRPLGESPLQLRFEPNQQQLKDWVARSLFVAASSTQLDPACFVRGAHAGLLWDFDIPANAPDAAGYYLIAGRSSSLAEGVRRGIDLPADVPVAPVLDEISRRGIPILRRLAAGGNQARGELGMLLGSRLLQDAFRAEHGEVVLPPVAGDVITMLLPVDPYSGILDAVRRELARDASDKRADLFVISVDLSGDRPGIQIRAVEIKNRPGMSPGDLRDALTQSENLTRLAEALWQGQLPNELWDQAARAFLARCLDHAFRLYADRVVHGLEPENWREIHEKTIRAVFEAERLSTVIRIASPRLVAFRDTTETVAKDLYGDGQLDTILIGRTDRDALLLGHGVTPALRHLVEPMFVRELGEEGVGTGTDDRTGSSFSPPAVVPEEVNGGAPSGDVPGSVGAAGDIPTPDTAEPGAASGLAPSPPSGSGAESDSRRGSSPVSPEARASIREAFAGFIGNEAAVAQVTRDLLAATLTDPPRLARNILFVGPPSVGKTEIARRIARALGLPFLRLDGPSLQSRDRLFDLLDEQLDECGVAAIDEGTDAGARVMRYPPFVVFVDEVHLVARAAQESLLTLLEPRDRQARIGNRVVRVPDATFLFATTRPHRIDNALRSRCVQIDLEPYSADQVAQMVRERVGQEHPEVEWEDGVFVRLANLSRLVPRAAFELAEDLWKEQVVSEYERSPLEHLKSVQRGHNLDDRGLRLLDFRYLTILERAPGPVGEDSLATQLGIDRDQLFDSVEPVLIRMNLVARGRGGRELTPFGRAYLAEYRLGDDV